MLKTLSLAADDTTQGGAAADPQSDEAANESEQKMRRALDLLSHQRPVAGEPEPAPPAFREPGFQRDQGGFRDQGNSFRDQGGRHELGHGAARRHRFVKDGEVPVVHMAPPRGREVAAPRTDAPPPPSLQPLLDQERLARDRAERSLAEVQSQLRVLQTKLAHTDMALQDATALAAARLVQVSELQAQVQAALAPPPPRAPVARTYPTDGGAADQPRKVGRPRTRPLLEKEPEPVKWWLQPAPKSRRRDAEPGQSSAFDWAVDSGEG